MKIRFSKKNKNVLYVDDSIITLPPCNNGCDLIPMGKLENNYVFDFEGLVVITNHGLRKVYHKGKFITQTM